MTARQTIRRFLLFTEQNRINQWNSANHDPVITYANHTADLKWMDSEQINDIYAWNTNPLYVVQR